jgi:hypothetical protein
MNPDPIIAAFDAARDKAVDDIMKVCCGGGSQRQITRDCIQEAFQPVLWEVTRRLKEASSNENTMQASVAQSLRDGTQYSP